ncbi:transcriptional regulator, AraC family [Halopseudomonas litoralis]|uniref:Transcriptional regulator, AraC family n=1 Tax=Halopseudomonas litoralis TaxID=797277 RepID=A0A1H1S4K6_9GAMM|nr:AraC family transcriptional regulator [Halopseudomonas litoralis]SDS42884.1 transcriptional regulator, AraC family [Halopseudomonas litoralis]
MNTILPPLPCPRLQERALWAKGIIQTLSPYGKQARDLPEDLRLYNSADDMSLVHVSQTDMNRLWHAAAHLSRDDCFALRMGQAFTSATSQLLALAARSSETAEAGIQRIIRFVQVFSTQAQLYSVEDEHHLTVYFEPKGAAHPLHIEALLSRCIALLRELETTNLPLIMEVRLSGDTEKRREECEQILGTRVRTGCKRVAVRLNRRALQAPLPTSDAFLLKRLDSSLEDMLEHLPNVDFAEQVKQRIRVLLSEREVSEDLVATPFNVSPRHLRRKLSETGTTYEKLLDEVRMELAIKLIQEHRLNLGRIAFELGFLDPSSFTRAFRRWTGMSPTAFREQSQGKSESSALP